MNAEILNNTVGFAPMLACGIVFGPGFVAIMLAFLGIAVGVGAMGIGNLFLIASRCRNTATMLANYGLFAACVAAVVGAFNSHSESMNPFLVIVTASSIVICQFALLLSCDKKAMS